MDGVHPSAELVTVPASHAVAQATGEESRRRKGKLVGGQRPGLSSSRAFGFSSIRLVEGQPPTGTHTFGGAAISIGNKETHILSPGFYTLCQARN